MEELSLIKDYYRKLQRIILKEADIHFFKYRLIKKNKIDDVLCCILAKLPDSYKKMMRNPHGKDYNSILSYNVLFEVLKRKFSLNPNLYLVDADKSCRLVDTILQTIDSDIRKIDQA